MPSRNNDEVLKKQAIDELKDCMRSNGPCRMIVDNDGDIYIRIDDNRLDIKAWFNKYEKDQFINAIVDSNEHAVDITKARGYWEELL